ncbi:hypothetical protein FRC03_004172 [Tulasnella sp. 419]|nr:hypothetical protein FRC03_004172 [Tulasnella sp. 419]
MTPFAVIISAFLAIQVIAMFVKVMMSLPSIITILIRSALSIAPVSYLQFILFIVLVVSCRSYLYEAFTHLFKYRWDRMESILWDHTAWDYPVDPNDPRSDRIIVCPLYMTLDRYPSSCWVRYHPTEGLKLFEAPLTSIRRWYAAQGRYTEARRVKPYVHVGSFEQTTQEQPNVARHQKICPTTAAQRERDAVHEQPRQPIYESRNRHVTGAPFRSGYRSPLSLSMESRRIRASNYQPPLIPFHHRELHRRAQAVMENLALRIAQPVSNYATDNGFDATNTAALFPSSSPQLQPAPSAQPIPVEPFYFHYWSELKTRLDLGEPLTRLQMDWLRAPSPILPFPTSLDEIHPQKQQSSIVDQPPITPTLSYSPSSSNASPTSTYVGEVSPVKITPTIHGQPNQVQPFTSMQKSMFAPSVEEYVMVSQQDVEMEPVEQVSVAASSTMIINDHEMMKPSTQWLPLEPTLQMQVDSQDFRNVQSSTSLDDMDMDMETSPSAASHQPALLFGLNTPSAHPDRPVKPLKTRLYNHLRVPLNSPNPGPSTFSSGPMITGPTFTQPAPVPMPVYMSVEAPQIALSNSFNFNTQVANPVVPPTNVAGPTSVTHPDRPVRALGRRFHRRG